MENISKFKRKRKLDPKIIRIGDKVKVVSPMFVERVGYPLSFKDGCEKAKELYNDKITAFLDDLFPGKKGKILEIDYCIKTEWLKMSVYDKIVKALAYEYLNKVGFGGRERKLFLKERPMFQDDYFYVSNIGIVKTGTYYPSSGGQDYFGDYYYEPGGLDDMKTHKILELSRYNHLILPNQYDLERVKLNYEALCIEACNVEKIFED